MGNINWKLMQEDYEQGLSFRAIEAKHNKIVSYAHIHMKAKEEGWVKGSKLTDDKKVAIVKKITRAIKNEIFDEVGTDDSILAINMYKDATETLSAQLFLEGVATTAYRFMDVILQDAVRDYKTGSLPRFEAICLINKLGFTGKDIYIMLSNNTRINAVDISTEKEKVQFYLPEKNK